MLITFLNFGTKNHSNLATNYKTITGIVSDAIGPIAGVNVLVKGTKNATTTNFDGKYSIVANEGDILEFTYTGMKKVSLSVGKSNVVNVLMKEENLTQNEVVVTGALGIKKRKDAITSSYTVVKAEEITQSANPNVVQSLAGKVSGLQITQLIMV